MIKIKLFLIGVVVGSLSTISIYTLYKNHQADKFKKTGESFGIDNAVDRSTDAFFAIANSEGFHLIPRENPLLMIDVEVAHFVNATNALVRIRNKNSLSLFFDNNLEGKWNQKMTHINGVSYLYSPNSGFPFKVSTPSNATVRIDGVYHNVHRIDGKQIVIQGGEKFEVDNSDLDHLTLDPFVSETNDATGQGEPEHQMKVVPYIPVPISKEQYDQLVEEGVLPPEGN